MDFFKSILFLTALSFTILLPNNIPTSTAIRNGPSPSPADAPLTFHIVSHDNTNPAAPSADPNDDDDEDKKKPSKKGVLGTAINPALRDICEATKIPNKCMDYLAPIATRAGGTYQDPVSILNLEVELLYKKVEKATDDAKDIVARKGGSTSPEVAKGLDACVGQYNKATDDLAKALLECSEKKNGATVEQMLSSALQSIRSCDAVFGGKSGEKDAPMAEANEEMIDMAELGMEISGKWLAKGKAQTKSIS